MSPNLLHPLWTPAMREICNHLWQSTLFAGLVALLALALRKHQAKTRYWLWMAASIKFLVPFSLLAGMGSHMTWVHHANSSKAGALIAIDTMSQPFSEGTRFSGPMISIAAQSPASHSSVALLPMLLTAVWLCGFTSLLAYWLIQWRQISRVAHTAKPLQEGREAEILRRIEQATKTRPIEILSSHDSMEPGVFGIVHPVLLWPEGISRHLDDAHLEAVLAHEVCHVQRRDNLTSVVHMLVKAIFWFHPLVWWMERQLVKEREHACDEEAVRLCNQPQVYAESILKVCEFCVESPLTCVAGITGADLKQRVVQIMTDGVASRLGFGGKCLLAAAALTSIALPVVFGQALGPHTLTTLPQRSARTLATSLTTMPTSTPLPAPAPLLDAAQSTPASAQVGQTEDHSTQPALDASLVGGPGDLSPRKLPGVDLAIAGKLQTSHVTPAGRGSCSTFGVTPEPDGVSVSCLTLKQMIEHAYGIPEDTPDSLVPGGPDWAGSKNFNLQAKLDEQTAAAFKKLTEEQQNVQRQLLLQSVLADHFQLKIHRETRETPVYALVPAKSGFKLKPAEPGQPDTHGMTHNGAPELPGSHGIAAGQIYGHAIPISAVVSDLNLSEYSQLDRMVIDKTGIPENYDIKLIWGFLPHKTNEPTIPGPSIFLAVQEQLGLELEPINSPMDFAVIDSAEMPSEY